MTLYCNPSIPLSVLSILDTIVAIGFSRHVECWGRLLPNKSFVHYISKKFHKSRECVRDRSRDVALWRPANHNNRCYLAAAWQLGACFGREQMY